MSEVMSGFGVSGGGKGVAEHSMARVLAGETEGVRRRLVYALEALGYSVTSESPLQARRRSLKDVVRADFTEYARKLSVSLRPSSDTAVVATFDFEVKHNGCMSRGDLQTLEREADAIVALAAAPPASTPCRACGTDNGGDAHFCRHCGAPSAARVPAELEVLRLTAGSRASLQEISVGLLIALLTLAVTLPMILFSVKPKVVNAGWIFFLIGETLGWLLTLYGVLRLHLTLNSKKRRARLAGAEPAQTLPQPLASARTTALPPAS
ncbi:MAG TPA: zinc ribbon domain-containing protein, partial [Pyrinomonadaceae bacterium]|nr:zinc ribbon domain-containing protein [Pyrinomonadaceae bacterium]